MVMNDSKALEHLGFAGGHHHRDKMFTLRGGLIQNVPGYRPTEKDYSAICYLCDEWDYSYEETD